MTVTVQLEARTQPATSVEILRHAILNTRPILSTPAPSIAVKSITADAIEFDIGFFVEELGQSTRAQNELFDWISRHLATAGIGLASSQSQPAWTPQPALPGTARSAAERATDLVAIFAGLTVEERKTLAAKTKRKRYDEAAVLVEPGAVLHSLFIIGSGIVSLTATASEGEIELLRLGPGDHFGEIGMLTGAGAQATGKALTSVTVYELSKDDLAPVLEARPEVSQELCRALAQRQAAGRLLASREIVESVPPSHLASWFSERLHRMFDLASAK
jgi:hypothetical protein